MHLVNILRIITFSFLVGHSILTISDFNSFRVFWDTLYIPTQDRHLDTFGVGIDGLQSISWDLQAKGMAAMLEENTLQIQ